jgi:hypothetical protein
MVQKKKNKKRKSRRRKEEEEEEEENNNNNNTIHWMKWKHMGLQVNDKYYEHIPERSQMSTVLLCGMYWLSEINTSKLT